MQTASVDASGTPANNYTVARVRQDLPNRSNVGAIVVNRNATGAFAGPDDVNRSYAVDGRWGMGETVTLSGFAAGTETPGVTGGAHAYNLAASYESERYRYGGGFTEVAPGFNPEAGFYARRAYRRIDGAFRTAFRPDNDIGFHEWTPHAAVFLIRDFDTGRVESDWIHLDNTMEWRNGFWASMALNLTTEGVFEPFAIFPGVVVPADRYDHAEAQLRFRTDQGAPVSLEFLLGVRRAVRRQPVDGGPAAEPASRRAVQHAGLLGPQRSRSARRRVRDEPVAVTAQLLVHAPACSSRRWCSTTTARGSGRRTSVSACCRTPTPGSSSSTTTSRASTDSVRRAPGAA